MYLHRTMENRKQVKEKLCFQRHACRSMHRKIKQQVSNQTLHFNYINTEVIIREAVSRSPYPTDFSTAFSLSRLRLNSDRY